jgi:NADPH:quinone reductase-like Zn-dependent oxidoreductase
MSQRIEFDAFGGPEVLHLVSFDPGAPGEGEVLIANRALGVNPFDWKFVSGRTSGGKEVSFPLVPGNEGSGVVSAVGAGVTDFAVGDEVIWRQFMGGYATDRVLPATHVYPKPASVSFEVGAGIPVAGGTSYAAISQAGVGSGDTVLVHAVAGGLGSAGVQIARSLGARVIGTGSADSADYIRSLGAEAVLYGDGLVERVRALGTITAAVDFVGTPESVAATVELLPDLTRAITSARSDQSEKAGIAAVKSQPGSIEAAIALAGSGKLTLNVSRTFPLERAGDAQALSRTGHVRGKIVLLV